MSTWYDDDLGLDTLIKVLQKICCDEYIDVVKSKIQQVTPNPHLLG